MYLRDDICRVPGVVVHDAGGVDVVGVGAVHQRVQHHPVVVVGELVRVAVLLLVLHLNRRHRSCRGDVLYSTLHKVPNLSAEASYLECGAGGVRFRFVCAESHPLLLEPLLVGEVVLHVGQHHVPGRDVHAVYTGLLLPDKATELFFRDTENIFDI